MPSAPLEPIPRGDDFELEIRGERFTGWKEVEFVRSLEAVSGSFRVVVNSSPRVAWPIRNQDPVTARVAGEVLLTGYVESFEGSSSSKGRTISVSGRDKTGDLVDCSATNDPSEWTNAQLPQLLEDLVQPFGITVEDERFPPLEGRPFAGRPFSTLPGDGIPHFALNQGETVWSAMERAGRLQGVLIFSTGRGSVVMAAPGERRAGADLLEGTDLGNILSTRVLYSDVGRFGAYTVLGQQRGSDESFGVDVAGIEGTATDPEIIRFRPLIVLAEGEVDFPAAKSRAEWEAITRAARGATLEVVVQGWRERPRGSLWQVNRLVNVDVRSWQIRGTMLIRAVRFTRNVESGQIATLSLVREDAYTPKPAVEESSNPFGDLLTGDDF